MASEWGRWALLGAALALLGVACGDREPAPARDGGAPRSSAPTVLVDAGAAASLVFTWADDQGQFHVTSDRAEIPEARRGAVRVQDPARPPSGPAVVWVADLSRPGPGGAFPVQPMSRADFEKLGRPPSKEPAGQSEPERDAGAQPGQVVMYMTSSCPVCRSARSWMNQQHISYVERNVESDPAAARELQEKARRQGIRADGVPVFEIGGRLMPGFDQQALARALGR